MLTLQQVYDNSLNYLRTNGNPYGSLYTRGWGWCNPDDTSERCAIASFIKGDNALVILTNLRKELDLSPDATIEYDVPLVDDIVELFDCHVDVVNDKSNLETAFKMLADKYDLKYTKESTVLESITMTLNSFQYELTD